MGFFDKTENVYREALKWLNYMYPNLHTHVLNLGKPKYVNNVPTAAVQHHGEGLVASSRSHYFEFIINPNFEKTLNKKDYVFILCHETFHILLGHLAVYKKFDNPMKFNIATDCIINDWLYNYGIEPDQFEPLYGPNIVGFNTSQSSLEEIYRLIPEEMCPEDGKCTGNCSGTPDASGDVGSGTCDCPQTVDDHATMFGDGKGGTPGEGQIDPNDVKKAIEDFIAGGKFDGLPDTAKDFIFDNNDIARSILKDDRPQGGWSPTGFGLTVEEQLADGVSLKWAELMQEITPDLYNSGNFDTAKERSFSRINKKMVSIHPKAILPASFNKTGGVGNNRNKDENTFVLALDCSGSVTSEDKRMFLALAHSIPTARAKVYTCTFSTDYVPYDLNGPAGQRTAGGGTDFSAIESFIQNEVVKDLGKYPKAVVVITDGWATFCRSSPTDAQLKNSWHWLLSNNAVHTSDDKVNKLCEDNLHNLKKFVK